MKQNASLDASFWINACAANIVEHISDYFDLFAPVIVVREIRYPLDILGIQAFSPVTFNRWIESGKLVIQEPQDSIDWYDPGENAAIALATENDYFLLIDDANPYHRAKSIGLNVVGTMEFIILLFGHDKLTHEAALAAIKQIRTSKKQKRDGLFALELLVRHKEK